MFRITANSADKEDDVIIRAACVETIEEARIFGMAVLQEIVKLPVTSTEKMVKDDKDHFYKGFFGKKLVGHFKIDQ